MNTSLAANPVLSAPVFEQVRSFTTTSEYVPSGFVAPLPADVREQLCSVWSAA